MANGIRTGNPRRFNKGRSSKFLKGSRVRQTPEEGRRTYRPKRCGNDNKDEDNSPKTLNDKKTLKQFSLFHFPFQINFSSKYLIQRTELFVGNQSLRLTPFTHFSRRSDFPRGKENVETRTAKCNTFVYNFCLRKYPEKL